MKEFDFTGYDTELLWDMVSEVGQKLFLQYANRTEAEKKKKHFYGYICIMLRNEIDRRMKQEYSKESDNEPV